MGFSNVGLGIVHSMAHALGAVYDTPHGVANAILLPAVMAYNADATGEKYRAIAKAMGVAGTESMAQQEYRDAAVDAVRPVSYTHLDVYKRQCRCRAAVSSDSRCAYRVYGSRWCRSSPAVAGGTPEWSA